jgi:hypothetical protein
MTEAEARKITGRIIAVPSLEAFDTASGAIVRLFAHLLALEKRVAALEKGRPRSPVAPQARPDRSPNGHGGDGDIGYESFQLDTSAAGPRESESAARPDTSARRGKAV